MKDGKFEVGDIVECVDNEIFLEMTKGEEYKFLCYLSLHASDYLYVSDKKGKTLGPYKSSRFKLAEPIFEYEYFSALNEKDALKYVGKVMEFADGGGVRNNKWKKNTFRSLTEYVGNYSFMEDDGIYFQFMRTCPETFQKKMVKKVYERWINLYPGPGNCYYRTEEEAKKNACDDLITCLHIRQEYEIEE